MRWPRRRRPRHFHVKVLPQMELLSDDPIIRVFQLHNLGLMTRTEVLETIYREDPHDP